MKKTLLILTAVLSTALTVKAQDDAVQKAAADAAAELLQAPKEEVQAPKPSLWTSSIQLNLGYNMTNLSNWAAGGYNTVTLTTNLDAKADYKKNLMSWNNRLQLDYGFLYSSDKEDILQKSNDRIYSRANGVTRQPAARLSITRLPSTSVANSPTLLTNTFRTKMENGTKTL